VVARPTNDAAGVGNEVPGWEGRGEGVCKASISSEGFSRADVSGCVDGPGEEVATTIGDTASSDVGGTVECSIAHSGTAAEVEASAELDCSPVVGSGRHSRFDC
jgi:hypothetical protein